MFDIDSYNEKRTLSLLESFFQTVSVRNVTPNMIYSILGEETAPNREYLKFNCWNNIEQIIENFQLIPHSMSPEIQKSYEKASLSEKFKIIYKYYSQGEYFHVMLNQEIQASERIIINMRTQANSTAFVLHLLNSSHNDAVRKIYSLKFYAKETSPDKQLLKYDKVVIYYNHKDFSVISATFWDLLPRITLPEINAFYNLYRGNDREFYFGVGKETTPDLSFSELRTLDIIEFITGIRPINLNWNEPIDCGAMRKVISLIGVETVAKDCFKFVTAKIPN